MTGGRVVALRDVTLREGLDTPGVALGPAERAEVLRRLDELGVGEAEVVAPGHFWKDLDLLAKTDAARLGLRCSGLVYAHDRGCLDQVRASVRHLHRVDLLIPLSPDRPPFGAAEKLRCVREVLAGARAVRDHVGVGFPHALHAEGDLLARACAEAAEGGAARITVYDTNGGADPFQVAEQVGRLRATVSTALWFHAHNDLGMATANSVAAVLAGADGLDVTVNGLGDRAGNASLEQVAVALHLKGVHHGLRLSLLKEICTAVAGMTGVPVSKLAPVVGECAHLHKSPSHLMTPALFEAFDPALVGAARGICQE